MTERALVVKTSGKIAVLQIEKKPECEGCKICAFKNGKSRVKVKALNTCGAKAGDTVVLYNQSAKGVLAAQDANESPSILGVSAEVKDGKALPANGGAVFTCLLYTSRIPLRSYGRGAPCRATARRGRRALRGARGPRGEYRQLMP